MYLTHRCITLIHLCEVLRPEQSSQVRWSLLLSSSPWGKDISNNLSHPCDILTSAIHASLQAWVHPLRRRWLWRYPASWPRARQHSQPHQATKMGADQCRQTSCWACHGTSGDYRLLSGAVPPALDVQASRSTGQCVRPEQPDHTVTGQDHPHQTMHACIKQQHICVIWRSEFEGHEVCKLWSSCFGPTPLSAHSNCLGSKYYATRFQVWKWLLTPVGRWVSKQRKVKSVWLLFGIHTNHAMIWFRGQNQDIFTWTKQRYIYQQLHIYNFSFTSVHMNSL